MKVSYTDCDLKDCARRVGPLDENGEHADLAGWISIRMGVYKLHPEEIEDVHTVGPLGVILGISGVRSQLEAAPLEGTFCSWPHAIAWLQGEAIVWQAAEAGR